MEFCESTILIIGYDNDNLIQFTKKQALLVLFTQTQTLLDRSPTYSSSVTTDNKPIQQLDQSTRCRLRAI